MTFRKTAVVVAVLALVAVASGCSVREVQLWFAINRKQAISSEQAKNIADLVNSKRPSGRCDGNYAGGCVPDAIAQVHCAATSGDGVVVRGPLTITNWDSFGLDPDGDKQACVDPVGAVDYLGQELDSIAVRGWTFDPNTTDPIAIDVYDGDAGVRIPASNPRSDIETAFPGAGGAHGFDLVSDPPGTGQTRKVCVFGINVGAGANQLLKCKTITIAAPGEYSSPNADIVGMLEAVDRTPAGIRLRGFVVSDSVNPVSYGLITPTGGFVGGLQARLTVVRDDVAEAFGVPTGTAYGFDFTIGAAGLLSHSSPDICIVPIVVGESAGILMCRPMDT